LQTKFEGGNKINLDVKEHYYVHTWGLQTFNSYKETRTQVAELVVVRPKNGAFKKAFLAPSFLFPSSFLFFLMGILVEVICGEVCQNKCRKIQI